MTLLVACTSATTPVPETAHDAIVESEVAHEADAEDAILDIDSVEIDEARLKLDVHPLDGWTPEEIREAITTNPAALGSVSFGTPNRGALFNGVAAEASHLYELVKPDDAWGTRETIDYLNAAIRKVHAAFPDTPPLRLGHISAKTGGRLRPHVSHQSGRDVDISFYYTDDSPWYARATKKNFDLPRNWAFVKALITETDIEIILVDRSIVNLLQKFALDSGEDPFWVRSIFRGFPGQQRPIVRHASGHATHFHLRFYNPIAQETARRAGALLVEAGLIKARPRIVHYRAKAGDTLGGLAARFGTTVEAIQRENGLRGTTIRQHRTYRIPVVGGAPTSEEAEAANQPLRFPPRRLPPGVTIADTRAPSPSHASLPAPNRVH
ncbi:MAG: penicillin-insensitive murein endopeptidase [Pseudomonadota bacterium]